MTINVLQPGLVERITVRGGVWDDDVFDQDWCNHAGAEVEDVLTDRFDTDLGQFVNDDSEAMLVCDKCGSTFVPDDNGGEWVE